MIAAAVAIVRRGPGQIVKSYDTDGTVTYDSANGGLLFLVIVGLLMVLLIAGILGEHQRRIYLVARRYGLVLHVCWALSTAVPAHHRRGRHGTEACRLFAAQVSAVCDQIMNCHRAYGTVPRFSARERTLRLRQRTVIARIRAAEEELDVRGRAAVAPLVSLLLKVADRYSSGRIGALLDQEDLAGVEPVPARETLRLAMAAALATAGSTGAALSPLPEAALTPLIPGITLLSTLIVYGRNVRKALSVFGTLRG